ncbi:MAG TPA: L,D-transpeptidase family protein [Planctomycetota bacterium]|nr:L,D-transpeptidase family protein [Planctomycetota bacterium]
MKRPWPIIIVAVLIIGVIFTYVKYVRGTADVRARQGGQEMDKTPDGVLPGTGQGQGDDTKPAGPGPLKGTAKNEAELAAAKAAELFRLARAAGAANDPKAIELYEAAVQTAPTSEAAIQAAAFLGDHYYKSKEAGKASEYLKIALSGPLADEQRRPLQEKLDELTSSEMVSKAATLYTVVPGDTLIRIAGRHAVPPELIAKMNSIADMHTIRAGEKFKVLRGPFNIVIEKSKYTLTVYMGDKYFKSYRIGLGKQDSTPEGTYKVEEKIKNPDWFRPGKVVRYGDPENVLGTRWIKFSRGYGIHGTSEPETIGTQASEGCVRMLNTDVEELFDLVVRSKSTVTIKP